MNTLKQLPELTALVEAGKNPFNQVLMNYVDQGGKTVGFMYQDTPEEIITAAGAAPIYLRGTTSEGTEMAEAFFRQLTCNYTKHTYNEILDGKWDFLDGAVLYNLCDHSRRIYDNWKTIPGNPAYHFMYVPKKRSELSKDFYREEINKLIKATEEHFGVEITKEKLAEAIKLHNETRRLQQEIYEMQKGEEVYLTGLELLMVMLAGVSLPRPEYNKMMKDLIAALKANGPRIKPKVRLLYTGGHADNPEFFELLQQNDAHVVSDNTGFGTRAADVLICEDGDPLEAIINYYFEEKPAATRQMGTQVERKPKVEILEPLGPLHDISEPDILEAFKSRVGAMKVSGEYDRRFNQNKNRISKELEHPTPVVGLKRATELRVWELSASVPETLPESLLRQAQSIPMPNLSRSLLFVDGTDVQSLKVAQKLFESQKDLRVVLVNGAPADVSEKLHRRVFFDQGGALVRVFGIEAVPALLFNGPEGPSGAEFAPDQLSELLSLMPQ